MAEASTRDAAREVYVGGGSRTHPPPDGRCDVTSPQGGGSAVVCYTFLETTGRSGCPPEWVPHM